jgi:hypothetical protein
MNWIKELINKKETKKQCDIHSVIPSTKYDWVEFEKEKPPHEVVLAACDTYDCGWTMDTVWWNEPKQTWMVTGTVDTQEAHLPYTHWRRLPNYPS